MSPADGKDRAFGDYATAAAISIIAAIFLLELWKADLHVPFDYTGDALLFSLIVKSTVDYGWFLLNPMVGAPGGLDLRDYPVSAHDSFHLLIVKAMSTFTNDWAIVFNLYFLIGFPLITLSAMAVFRHFRIGAGPAIVGAVLYAFLPSRLLKGEGHLFMDVFYQVPLAIMVILWVCSDEPPIAQKREGRRWPALDIRRTHSWCSLLICALIASTSLYYAFFSACLLVAGGAWATVARRSIRNVIAGLSLAGVIFVGLALNAVPTLIYQRSHGPNHAVAERKAWEAEVYGMKIAQLLLPTEGHRVPALLQLNERYNESAPLGGENSGTSLGLVGDVGFLALLARVLLGRAERSAGEPMRPLGVLNLVAVLFGTIGGFGSLFALLVSPQIRTYCRLNVFIGFFSLFAVVLLLDQLVRRRPRVGNWVPPVVLAIGLLDQVSPRAVRPYAANKRVYESDAQLVHGIEATLMPGAAVFELPYMDFPEPPPRVRMGGYEPLRPYLHSQALRWSYPAMRGRPGDTWARDLSEREPRRMVDSLIEAGFGGILIDRDGYGDRACVLEAAFRAALGSDPLVSQDNRLAFFSLSRCKGRVCEACGAPDQPCCPGGECGGGFLCRHGRCECGGLESGESLATRRAITSCDGRFALTMEGDGNLVLRGCSCTGPGGSCWTSNSTGHTGSVLEMRSNGNLVTSSTDCAADSGCWSSNTVDHPGAFLRVQNDGNICVTAPDCTGPNGTCWCSNTCCH
jgi:phosphoglycerol transferase